MMTRSVIFRDDVIDELTTASEQRKVSVNWLVNQLCREGLDRLKPEIKVTQE